VDGNRRFNSRAHAGRDLSQPQLQSQYVFQFTRPRGARPEISGDCAAVPVVSIHAPTRGATLQACIGAILQEFQFTRPRGARLAYGGRRPTIEVSIHAPTRGATEKPFWRGIKPPPFQFTRPRGARHLTFTAGGL